MEGIQASTLAKKAGVRGWAWKSWKECRSCDSRQWLSAATLGVGEETVQSERGVLTSNWETGIQVTILQGQKKTKIWDEDHG